MNFMKVHMMILSTLQPPGHPWPLPLSHEFSSAENMVSGQLDVDGTGERGEWDCMSSHPQL